MTERERPYTSSNGTEHYEADGFVWQRRIEQAVRLRGHGVHGLASVTATWDVAPNSPAVSPGSVSVRRARTDGEIDARVDRGVSSSVLRDAERVVVAMTKAMPAQIHGLALPDPMDKIREVAANLPASPRERPSYYRELLALHRMIERTNVPNPVKVLCEVTGRPEGTMKLHLRKARAEVSS